MGNTFSFAWEVPFMQCVQSCESAFSTALAVFFTMMGEEYLMILVLGLCYWCIDKNLGRRVALTLSGSALSGSLLKGLVLRRRPYMDHSEVNCIRLPHPGDDPMSVVAQGYSMPSLHSALSAGVYGTLAINTKKRSMIFLAVALPLCIGLSRIYLGVHYPTDVLSGWILGTAVMLLLYLLERKYGYRISFLVVLVIGAIGIFYCRDNEFYSCYGVVAGLFFGFLYEEKYVRFEMSKKWRSYLLRPVFGVLFFALISAVLKLLLSALPGDSPLALQLACRCLRYALSTFFVIGIYPHLFKHIRFL